MHLKKENLHRCCEHASAVNIYVSLANLLQKSDAEKIFQIFQTTAGLKKYKQHDVFFWRGVMGVWAKFGPYQFTDYHNLSDTFTVIFESYSFKLQCMMSCHDFFSTEVTVGTRLITCFQLYKTYLWLLLIKNVFLSNTVLYFKNQNWIQVFDWVDTQV